MILKYSVVLIYIGIAVLVYQYGEQLLHAFRNSSSLGLAVIVAACAALFPVLPFPVVAGVLGAAFGSTVGGVIAWAGSTLASFIMFLLVRYVFQAWGQRVMQRQERLGRLNAMFERNAFLAIVFARLIPVMPAVLVNCYSALSRVPFPLYAAASALGKLPSMLLFAMVGSMAVTEPLHIVAVLGLYGGFLGFTLLIYRSWNRQGA